MRTVSLVIAMLFFWILQVQAQGPRSELFGGYSLFSAEGAQGTSPGLVGVTGAVGRSNLNGFGTSLSAGGKHWGAFFEFAYHQGRPEVLVSDGSRTIPVREDAKVFQFGGGPRISFRTQTATVFFHGSVGSLIGRFSRPSITQRGITITTEGSASTANYTVGGGGGLDFNVSNRISIRAVQFDYIGEIGSESIFGGGIDVANHFRFQSGIVFKFGVQ